MNLFRVSQLLLTAAGAALCTAATCRAAGPSLPPADTEAGYIALLIINETPCPGEKSYLSAENSKAAMRSVLAVLDNRINAIPPGYSQKEVAHVASESIIDIITTGGVRGQVDGFYRSTEGEPITVDRVRRRADYLLAIARRGKPGTFSSLLEYASALASSYVQEHSRPEDIYKDIRTIERQPVTGRGYSWMTDAVSFHPGGNLVTIPNSQKGSLGGNRFFTLKKDPVW